MSFERPTLSLALADKLPDALWRKINGIAALPDVRRLAVMPDVHDGPIVPNGIAVATAEMIYPELVGGDIGCGVSAIKLEADSDFLKGRAADFVLGALRKIVPTLKRPKDGSNMKYRGSPAADELSVPSLARHMEREGTLQLGTLGRGNHFIELDREESDDLWVVVHSGSRSMGRCILDHHRRRSDGGVKGVGWGFKAASEAGKEYLADADWALRYAKYNRLLILNLIGDFFERRWGIRLDESSYVDSPHNFVRLEAFADGELIVHRKSANSAKRGQVGIIPGSMSSGCRIVRGLGREAFLDSSSHGAGRRLGRKDAFGAIKTREFVQSMEGIAFDRARAATLRDEAPQAYRDIDEVMRAQRELVRCVSVLRPVLCDKRS